MNADTLPRMSMHNPATSVHQNVRMADEIVQRRRGVGR